MMDKLLDTPVIVSLVVVTTMLIVVFLVKWRFKAYVLLWRGTLVSYIVFVTFIFMRVLYEHSFLGGTPFYEMAFNTLSMTLLAPAMLIYSLIPGMIKPCPSDFDFFAILTIGFLFYALIFWGIMKVIKQRKETKAAEKKQNDNLKKQTPSETDLKGV